MQKATQQQTKIHNRNLVLKTLFARPTTSRAQIARATGLTRTTVSDTIAELITEGLVQEMGPGASRGGKTPILLSLAANSRYLVGLDLARHHFRGAIIDLRGQIRKTVTLSVKERRGEEALNLVYTILDQLIGNAGQPIIGIGVGTPGLVDTDQGIVVNAVNLGWEDLPLASLLQERYHLPVRVLNDSQAAAVGEYAHGADYASDSSLVVINARQGLGAGIIINGHLFYGDGGGAGEIGHVVVEPNGLPCRCGNRGCLETVASVRAIQQRLEALTGQPWTLEKAEQAFAAGEPAVRQVVLEAGETLGRAIAGLVGILNIHEIVLTGDMVHFGSPWLEAVQSALAQTIFPHLVQETHVGIGRLGEDGILLGSAALLAQNYELLFTHTS